MPFKKGQVGNPNGRPVGSKNRETLLKEERRAIFDAMVSQDWEKTISQLPPTYKADQFLGKAPEEHKFTGVITTTTIPEEALRIIEEDLKKKKTE